MAPEFPSLHPDDEIERKPIRLTRKTWRRLKEVGAEQKPKRSLNAVVEFFLEWALRDYEAAQLRKKEKK